MVCGMGGSAIGADLAAVALGERSTIPLLTVRGYELPSWATPEWLVVCSSFSGNTEETLACWDAAGALGARRIAATTGGALAEVARGDGEPVIGLPGILPSPRTAVGYTFGVAAESAALAGATRINTEIDAAAAGLEGRGMARRASDRDRRSASGHGPGHLRRRPDDTGRAALEDRDQRERRSCPLSGPSSPRPTTTRSRAGRAPRRRPSAPSFSRTPISILASARRIELTADVISPNAAQVVALRPRERPAPSGLLGGHARRPRVAAPRRRARHRPDSDRRDRVAQEAARQH